MTKLQKMAATIFTETPLVKMVTLIVLLWLGVSATVFLIERGAEGATITTYGKAMHWALMPTASADNPPCPAHLRVIGGAWCVVGCLLFWSTILVTFATYPSLKGRHDGVDRLDLLNGLFDKESVPKDPKPALAAVSTLSRLDQVKHQQLRHRGVSEHEAYRLAGADDRSSIPECVRMLKDTLDRAREMRLEAALILLNLAGFGLLVALANRGFH